jgi:hypothetical protein
VNALREFYIYYGGDLKVEFPTSSGHWCSLEEVANQVTERLCSIFVRDSHGKRAVLGDNQYFQSDSYWRDNIPFFEPFNGDTGEGLGASHQTGWTAIVASLLFEKGRK